MPEPFYNLAEKKSRKSPAILAFWQVMRINWTAAGNFGPQGFALAVLDSK
jgi:hypothetical protein